MAEQPQSLAQLQRDRRDLKRYIQLARAAITELAPSALRDSKLSDAQMEMSAVLESTESAAEAIMRQAEMGLAGRKGETHEKYRERASDAFLQIIEACSFQDLTGQRISKVVRTLKTIEDRLANLEMALGERFGEDEGEEAMSSQDEIDRLLQGPPLPGSGISQNDVDALMG